MMTYRRWTWLEDATEDQMESAANKGAVERLATEARNLYDSIPTPRSARDYDDDDRASEAGDAFCEDMTDQEYAQHKKKRSEAVSSKWGELEAIEQLMTTRGARFARDYEHHNEDEQMIEYLENRSEGGY